MTDEELARLIADTTRLHWLNTWLLAALAVLVGFFAGVMTT